MSGRTKIDIYAVVDSDGEYEIGRDEDEATERFEENYASSMPRQLIHMSIGVPLPRVVEVTGELPERADAAYSLELKDSE